MLTALVTSNSRARKINLIAVLLILTCTSFCTNAISAQIAAGESTSCAIDDSGHLYCWGDDSSGQLGIGRPLAILAPALVGNDYVSNQTKEVKIVGGNAHVLVLKADNSLWTWGWNAYGQLGDGNRVNRATPLRVLTNAVSVAAGYSESFAVKSDGSLWGWGTNAVWYRDDLLVAAKLGDGFAEIFASNSASSTNAGTRQSKFALKKDGTLWAWGDNSYGQLGDGTKAEVEFSKLKKIGERFKSIAACPTHTVALKEDGSLWTWGDGSKYKLGSGTSSSSLTPVQVQSGFASVACGLDYTIGIKSDGTLWLWGVVRTTLNNAGFPVESIEKNGLLLGAGFSRVSSGLYHWLALKSDGSLLSGGSNGSGQLGDGTQTDGTLVAVGDNFSAIGTGAVSSYGVKKDGTLWSWGGDSFGQLGSGVVMYQTSPVLVGEGYTQVTVGTEHVVVLDKQSNAWTFGLKVDGRYSSNPKAVGMEFAKVIASSRNTYALKRDKSLWGWGPDWSAMGVGSSITLSQMNTVRKLGDDYVDIFPLVTSGGALGLKSDGSLWVWGDVFSCGDSSPKNRYIPTLLGSGFTTAASHNQDIYAIKKDGTLWRCGILSKEGWILIEGGNWKSLSSGDRHVLLLKSDGTLYGMGSNKYGQVPISAESFLFVPTLIGSGYTAIAAGKYHSVALRNDGTIWGWGRNSVGQIGDGTVADQTSPQPTTNTDLSDFLDLLPSIKNIQIPTNVVPFFAKTRTIGGQAAMTASIDVYGPRSGLVPNGRSLKNSYGKALTYNIYIAANDINGKLVQWYQLDSKRNWGPLQWPIAEFLSNVSLASSADRLAVDILDNADLSGIAGTDIYLGYGVDATEMIEAGRYKKVLTVPKQE